MTGAQSMKVYAYRFTLSYRTTYSLLLSNYVRPAQSGPMRPVSVRSGKCTTQDVTQSASLVWFLSLDKGYRSHAKFADRW